jgi:hypothetical protein
MTPVLWGIVIGVSAVALINLLILFVTDRIASDDPKYGEIDQQLDDEEMRQRQQAIDETYGFDWGGPRHG